MMAVAERFDELKASSQATNWRGRSGRFYALTPVAMAQFSVAGPGLYLLAAQGRVLWVGTADDLVADAVLRARFRAALSTAEQAFALPLPDSDVDRMTMAWDLEDAEPVSGLSLT